MAETPKKGAGQFTDGDVKLFTAMIQNLKGDIDTDWDVVASLCGYKDKTIAKTRWAQIKKKKITGAGGSSDDLKIKARTPKKKAAAEMDGADENEDEEAADPETPKTEVKKKKAKRTPKKVKTEPVEDEDEEAPADEETF